MTLPTTLHFRLSDGAEEIVDISHLGEEKIKEIIAAKDDTTIVVEQLSIINTTTEETE